MPVSRPLRVGIGAMLLFSCITSNGTVMAGPRRSGTQAVPRVFLPVVPRFARSPIPVFFPMWLPPIPRSQYVGKVYPGFQTFKRQHGTGPGYLLGLYTSPHIFDHAHRLFSIGGVTGDVYTVNTHTRPVWLGKRGWAYVDPDGNAGTTISFARAPRQTSPPQEYTNTIALGCPALAAKGWWPRYVACLKHLAASVQRYVPHPRRG